MKSWILIFGYTYYSNLTFAGVLAVHETCEQKGCKGLLRGRQTADGPGDDDKQDQVQEIPLQRSLPGE